MTTFIEPQVLRVQGELLPLPDPDAIHLPWLQQKLRSLQSSHIDELTKQATLPGSLDMSAASKERARSHPASPPQ